MAKKGYIFTNKQHTNKGIMSTSLGFISLATLAYVTVMSYRLNGDVPQNYGSAALLATVFAFVGVILGVLSRNDYESFHLFTYLGIGLNILALAAVSIILYAGAYLTSL